MSGWRERYGVKFPCHDFSNFTAFTRNTNWLYHPIQDSKVCSTSGTINPDICCSTCRSIAPSVSVSTQPPMSQQEKSSEALGPVTQ
ncbi:uncharacterized protein [Ambystoma mexicanum]|uniref:uncharacterized protein isoform X2 n=1 Tax=Ambystoma mexicanum TaxID=8296 RepID=UPI0037E832E7